MRGCKFNALFVLSALIASLILLQYVGSYWLLKDTTPTANINLVKDTPKEEDAIPNLNQLYYVARFGLGHRLSKLSAAYHLARHELDLPRVELYWGNCKTPGREDVFEYLFGTHQLTLRSARPQDHQNKQILVRNDVSGYYAGQNLKNARVAIPAHFAKPDHNPWYDKLASDRGLFRDLLRRFGDRTPAVSHFQQSVHWHNHTVVGLHIRTGNGEQDHFVESGRGRSNATIVVQNICRLLDKHVFASSSTDYSKVLLFLATDTQSVIADVQRYCAGVKVITFNQSRVEATRGVSYQQWDQGNKCFDGWRSSMTDMSLLAQSDVLIAGMRSTFTQILPRAMVMERGNQYCEVHETGRHMSCFRDERAWLFRQSGREDDFSLEEESAVSVVHKTLVHLPDLEPSPWMEKARSFLRGEGDSSETVFAYGERFDAKYRRKGQEFQEQWTFEKE